MVDKYVRYEFELQPWFATLPRGMLRAPEQQFGGHMLIVAEPA